MPVSLFYMVSSPPVTDIDPSVFFKNCLRREAAKKAMVHNIQRAKKKKNEEDISRRSFSPCTGKLLCPLMKTPVHVVHGGTLRYNGHFHGHFSGHLNCCAGLVVWML